MAHFKKIDLGEHTTPKDPYIELPLSMSRHPKIRLILMLGMTSVFMTELWNVASLFNASIVGLTLNHIIRTGPSIGGVLFVILCYLFAKAGGYFYFHLTSWLVITTGIAIMVGDKLIFRTTQTIASGIPLLIVLLLYIWRVHVVKKYKTLHPDWRFATESDVLKSIPSMILFCFALTGYMWITLLRVAPGIQRLPWILWFSIQTIAALVFMVLLFNMSKDFGKDIFETLYEIRFRQLWKKHIEEWFTNHTFDSFRRCKEPYVGNNRDYLETIKNYARGCAWFPVQTDNIENYPYTLYKNHAVVYYQKVQDMMTTFKLLFKNPFPYKPVEYLFRNLQYEFAMICHFTEIYPYVRSTYRTKWLYDPQNRDAMGNFVDWFHEREKQSNPYVELLEPGLSHDPFNEHTWHSVYAGEIGEQRTLDVLTAYIERNPEKCASWRVLSDINIDPDDYKAKHKQNDLILITENTIYTLEVKNWNINVTTEDLLGASDHTNVFKQAEGHKDGLAALLAGHGVDRRNVWYLIVHANNRANDSSKTQRGATPKVCDLDQMMDVILKHESLAMGTYRGQTDIIANLLQRHSSQSDRRTYNYMPLWNLLIHNRTAMERLQTIWHAIYIETKEQAKADMEKGLNKLLKTPADLSTYGLAKIMTYHDPNYSVDPMDIAE